MRQSWAVLALTFALAGAGPSHAQPAPAGRDGPNREAPPSDDARKLPSRAVTAHSVELPGRTLRFTVTLSSVPLFEGEGGPLIAEIATMAFRLDGADGRQRPVTFLFNGGPGAASAYLNLGAVGPWRLPLASPSPSLPPVPVPNPETWLDFTDLVFVDPVGTGYSWGAGRGDDIRRRFYGVEADAQTLAVTIRKWLDREGRLASPKYLVGESYGGFRVPVVARILQGEQGIGVSGMVMLSPVLDFGWRFQPRHAPLRWVAELPSMAAASLAAQGRPFDREALRPAEAYAAGEFLADLLRGPRDRDAVGRMSTRVAELTGVGRDLVQRLGGRLDAGTFTREIGRGQGRVASLYDATVTTADPQPTSAQPRYEDPVLDGIDAPLAAAMTELYHRLGWKLERQYRLLNREVNGQWQWGGRRTQPQAVDDLASVLALDPAVRAVVAHGATDLVTPYFETQLILNQIPSFDGRLRLVVYPGGHMFYSRDDARAAFRADGQTVLQAARLPPGSPDAAPTPAAPSGPSAPSRSP